MNANPRNLASTLLMAGMSFALADETPVQTPIESVRIIKNGVDAVKSSFTALEQRSDYRDAIPQAVHGTVAVESQTSPMVEEKLRIRLDLKDGTSIYVTPETEVLPVTARYGWSLDVPFCCIASLTFHPDATNAFLRLQDDDQLTVRMREPSIKLQSLLGRIEVKAEHIVSLTVVPAQVDLPPSLRDGLLAFYPFASDEGTRSTDRSSMKRHGKVVNVQWTASGKIGGAMRFGPASSYIVAPDKGLPMGDAPRSVAFWMKLDNTQSSGNAVAYGPMRHNQAFMLGMDWRLGRNSMAFSQHGAVNVAQRKFETDRWYHIVYTYGGRNEHTFYIDGASDNLAVREIGMGIETASVGNLFIGSAGPEAGSSFDGWLDEVMVYDRVLSPSEVRQLHERR